jgi:hypothetical protein
LSETGAVQLLFGGDNVAKFTDVQFSTAELKMSAPSGALKPQGQTTIVGVMALNVTLQFKFDGKACTGTGVAKFGDPTAVTVNCQ